MTYTIFSQIFSRTYKDVRQAPEIIKKLFWTDLFCWMGVMGQMMYITDYMAKVVFQGSPDAEDGSKEDILFQQGIRMGSFGMLLHSLVGMKNFLMNSFQVFVGSKSIALSQYTNSVLLHMIGFSLLIRNVRARSVGTTNRNESNLSLWVTHICSFYAYYGNFSFCDYFKSMCCSIWIRNCRCKHNSWNIDNKISHQTRTISCKGK